MRAVVYVAGNRWRLLTRTGRDATEAVPELAVVPDLVHGRQVVLDGEMVALDPAGIPRFARLQQRMPARRPTVALLAAVPVQLYLFDLLHLDGDDTLDLPYTRRQLLEDLDLDSAPVRTPPAFPAAGIDLLAAVEATGLEGVVSKRMDSRYEPGRRSRAWIKTLVPHTTRAVIAGWIPGHGRRAGRIGALILAACHDDGRLRYLGRAGTGLTDAALRELGTLLQPLTRDQPTAHDVPADVARHTTWVEPVLVAQVAYRTVEADGLRHPSWRGLLPGIDPRTVRPPT